MQNKQMCDKGGKSLLVNTFIGINEYQLLTVKSPRRSALNKPYSGFNAVYLV